MTQAEKGEAAAAENGKDKERDKEREQRGAKRPIVPAAVPESLQEVRPAPCQDLLRRRGSSSRKSSPLPLPLEEAPVSKGCVHPSRRRLASSAPPLAGPSLRSKWRVS